MENFYVQKVIGANEVFDDHFVDIRNLYLHSFNSIPCMYYINGIDGEKAFELFRKNYGAQIKQLLQYRWFNQKEKKYSFDQSIVVLENRCVIEFNQRYCEILHDGNSDIWIDEITGKFQQFKEKIRRQPLEINLVVQERSNLVLRAMEIKRTKLDLSLFYEDDFIETDVMIRKRLNQKKDKGIVLLHGLPGAGKTSYLRYLVGKLKKRVLFLSPAIAENIMNPEFVELLINNPDSVVIIEDAENIIMDRKISNSSSVSNLLNISDGLLADFLNVQLVCTFNNSLSMIDNALIRKGRLIAKYEFGRLSIAKAQRLSDHFGNSSHITKPMTIAEIANQHEKDQKATGRVEVMGFRRHEVIEN